MFRNLNEEQLTVKCNDMRMNILEMIYNAGSGHPGGSFSSVEMLTVLYNKIMKHDPSNSKWEERDRFVLSKGHVCPALYAVLADCGYFDKSELNKLRKFGSVLQGHPYMHKTNGLDVSSGSLGQGLSVSVGMALGARIDAADYRVYCLMGDGETQEGQVWEAAMAAGHYKLDNLCGIVDFNKLQIDGSVEKVMNINPYKDKWLAFNWNVIEVDGHDVIAVEKAYKDASEYKGKPTMIIAHTAKGKGVSFMENVAGWHGVAPNKEQYEAAMKELRSK